MDFTIIATGCSGTKFLCELINRQSGFRCHLEIFNPSSINLLSSNHLPLRSKFLPSRKQKDTEYVQNNFSIQEQELLKKIHSENLHFLKNEKFEYVLNLVKELTPEDKIGYKIFYSHLSKIKTGDFFSYIKKNNTKIIHFYRKNRFAENLCRQKKATQRAIPQEGKLNFNIDLYLFSKQKFKFNFEKQKQKLIENNIPYIELTYAQIAGSNQKFHMERVMNFINDKDIQFISPPRESLTFQKNNIYTLEQQIENLDELKEILKDDTDFLEILNGHEYI
jgi:hypothetical protein